jgi:hypothetical protein
MATHIVVSVRETSGRPDLLVEMRSDTTVAELKQRIEEEHDCHPPAASQRLIFAGRLLADHATIKDALKEVSCSE